MENSQAKKHRKLTTKKEKHIHQSGLVHSMKNERKKVGCEVRRNGEKTISNLI